MTDQTVTQTPHERTYAGLAAELRRIADDFDKIGDRPCPSFVELHMQPGDRGDDEQTVAAVDAVGSALFGTTGEFAQMSSGSYHYEAKGRRGPIAVAAYNSVTHPEQLKREAELAELRAEVERLRSAAKPADLHEGRTTAVGEAKPDTLVQPLGRAANGGA
jgi:hypothetical protein